MAVLRIEAFQLLADLIASEVPELSGKICPYPSEPEHRLGAESMGIMPTRFKYMPNQAKPFDESIDYGSTMVEVGQHVIDIEMELHAANLYRRTVLEEKIVEVFLKQELSPGVISMTVPTCNDVVVSWELDGEEWIPEKVFDKQWFSSLNVTGHIPAIATHGETYTLEQLRLGLYEDPSSDLDTTITPETFDTHADIERVEVESDGTFTAL